MAFSTKHINHELAWEAQETCFKAKATKIMLKVFSDAPRKSNLIIHVQTHTYIPLQTSKHVSVVPNTFNYKAIITSKENNRAGMLCLRHTHNSGGV